MSEEKKVPRKLPGKSIIMVDPQIIRWRKEMRRRQKEEGVFLGRHSKKQREKVDKDIERNADKRALKSKTKRFF